uniref:Uncharacterized protein n=1 Tax=Cacopsylla melanoneura TaxID=428564 RepID=A0A8D8XQ35_9HEMI
MIPVVIKAVKRRPCARWTLVNFPNRLNLNYNSRPSSHHTRHSLNLLQLTLFPSAKFLPLLFLLLLLHLHLHLHIHIHIHIHNNNNNNIDHSRWKSLYREKLRKHGNQQAQ